MAIVIGGGLMLFASPEMIEALGLEEFRQGYRAFIGPVWITAVSWLSARAIGRAIEAADPRALLRAYKRMRRQQEVLANLSDYERELLAAFIIQKQTVVYVPLEDRRTMNLLENRVIYSASGIIHMEIGQPHGLNAWASRRLRRNPKLLGDATGEGFRDPAALDRSWDERI